MTPIVSAPVCAASAATTELVDAARHGDDDAPRRRSGQAGNRSASMVAPIGACADARSRVKLYEALRAALPRLQHAAGVTACASGRLGDARMRSLDLSFARFDARRGTVTAHAARPGGADGRRRRAAGGEPDRAVQARLARAAADRAAVRAGARRVQRARSPRRSTRVEGRNEARCLPCRFSRSFKPRAASGRCNSERDGAPRPE